MAEYIDREALLKSKQWLALQDLDRARAKAIILEHPTADVVEVVRCKDCQHSDLINCERWCTLHDVRMDNNDFCSYGEAKMDGKGE